MCLDGVCTGTPKSCDDSNFCTTDSCNETTGECEHQCNVNVPGRGYCRIDSCNWGYTDCNHIFSDGCETCLNNNYGSFGEAVSLDEDLCGDLSSCSGAENFKTAKGEGWYKVYLKEYNDAPNKPLKIKARLIVPPDVDYDLYLYSPCHNLLASSENHSLGADEIVTYTKTDTSSNDSQWF